MSHLSIGQYILHPFFLQSARTNQRHVLLNLEHKFLLIYFLSLSIHLQASYFHFFTIDLELFHYRSLAQKTKLHKYQQGLYLLLFLKRFHHTPLEQFPDFYHNPPLSNFFHFQFDHKQTSSSDSLTTHYQGLLYQANHKQKINRNIENQDCLLQKPPHCLLQNHQNSKNCNQM